MNNDGSSNTEEEEEKHCSHEAVMGIEHGVSMRRQYQSISRHGKA